jgi:hypothetical protein
MLASSNQRKLLSSFSPQSTNCTFDCSMTYNGHSVTRWPSYVKFIASLRCQTSEFQSSAFGSKLATILGEMQMAASCSHNKNGLISLLNARTWLSPLS